MIGEDWRSTAAGGIRLDTEQAQEGVRTMRFLVIDDDERLADVIRRALGEHAYAVDISTLGHEGEMMAVAGTYDCIILDLILPDHDGIQICRNLRRGKVSAPILILTGLSSTDHKVDGLNAGADDYLTKPFDIDELVARVRALLRRSQASEATVLRFEDIEMNLVKRAVHRNGKSFRLTAREFALLEYFLRHPNRVLTRMNLGERVWGTLFEEQSNVIDVYVSRIRRKIDNGFDKQLFHTVIGAGYMLSADEDAA